MSMLCTIAGILVTFLMVVFCGLWLARRRDASYWKTEYLNSYDTFRKTINADGVAYQFLLKKMDVGDALSNDLLVLSKETLDLLVLSIDMATSQQDKLEFYRSAAWEFYGKLKSKGKR